MASFTGLFKKTKYASLDQSSRFGKITDTLNEEKAIPNIPDGLWTLCDCCGETLYTKDIAQNLNVCPKCNHHFRMDARDRLSSIIDEGTFIEYDKQMQSVNPINYPDYEEKLLKSVEKSKEKEAIITGQGEINGNKTVIAIMDFNFMGGSLGSVVGEKITRAVEKATQLKQPFIIFTTSGGARMQEGIFSLMQMAKTSAALARFSDAGLLYTVVLTDPTTGGVSASYAMLGDIILAEPNALICFAGPRVIEQTIRQKLPMGFQKSEFLLDRGFVDHIVPRKKMKEVLSLILEMHSRGVEYAT